MKNTPSTPATALQTATPLAIQNRVPDRIPISQDEWPEMSIPEREAALMFFREEEEEGRGLPVTFPRIAYPTSGASHWIIPSPDQDDQAVKVLKGVIVHAQACRAWWPLNQEVSNNPPSCFSYDGRVPAPY